MKISVIINPKAGSIRKPEELIKEIISGLKVGYPEATFDFFLQKNDEAIYSAYLNNMDCDLLIICGGDGTISSSIDKVKDKSLLIGILPMGTFNHFAKDNNIPFDLQNALNNIIEGNVTEIDLAVVNGRAIINNSSIGVYAKSVLERKNLKYNKILKLIIALFKVLIRFPVYRFNVKTKERDYNIKSSFIFIGNNFYSLDLRSLGSRDSVEKGILSVYFSKSSSRLTFLKFAFKLLFNKLEETAEFEILYTEELKIESSKKVIDVSVDGEILKMTPPLNYKLLQKKIKLLTPLKYDD